jgi:hypothetical protein
MFSDSVQTEVDIVSAQLRTRIPSVICLGFPDLENTSTDYLIESEKQ